jgi:hypothetical protein
MLQRPHFPKPHFIFISRVVQMLGGESRVFQRPEGVTDHDRRATGYGHRSLWRWIYFFQNDWHQTHFAFPIVVPRVHGGNHLNERITGPIREVVLEAEILNGPEGAPQSLSALLSDRFRYPASKASKKYPF